MTRFSILIGLLALSTALVAAGPALAQDAEPKPPATPTGADALVRLDGPTSATAEIRQTWEGASAKAMRQSLDAIFGDRDKVLNQQELDRVAAAVGQDITGENATFLAWDGSPAVINNAAVTFENGTGPIASAEALTMIHTLKLNLTAREGIPHELVLTPLWNGTFRLEWATGWAAQATGGLDAPAVGNGSLTARIAQAAPVTIVLGEAQPDPATTAASGAGAIDSTPMPGRSAPEAEPIESSEASTRDVPMPATLGLLAGLLAAALLARRGAGRKDR